jgi:hypothetical protein
MTEQTENLVLEILRRLHTDMADLKAGQQDIQHRLTPVETTLPWLGTPRITRTACLPPCSRSRLAHSPAHPPCNTA